MSVSIYMDIHRATPLDHTERIAIANLMDQFNQSHDLSCEDLFLDGFNDMDSGVIEWHASIKPTHDMHQVLDNMMHILTTLSTIKNALPGSEWAVTLDDLPIEWSESLGFYLE